MPYGNRVIHLDFPEISAEGDAIWIKLRNPQFLAPEEVTGSKHRAARAAADADGDGAEGESEDEGQSYDVFARLIIGWHVYDATDDADHPAAMPIPATPALVRKLPVVILTRLGEELAKANPQKPTEPQEAGTSKMF